MSLHAELIERFRKAESEHLAPLVKLGQATLMIEDGLKTRATMCAQLVGAPPDVAWETLLDYDKYKKFLPGISHSHVLSRTDKEIVVKFVAEVKVMGIGGTLRYTYRFDVQRPYIMVYDAKTGKLHSYWAALPVENKKETMLVYLTDAYDIKSIHFFFKVLLERLPNAEIGLAVSPAVMLTHRMKQRIEQVYHKK